MLRLNPTWKNEVQDKLKAYQTAPANGHERPILTWTVTFNKAAQYLVIKLTEAEIPFRVLNLGVGVKKITTDTTICPKCKGTGHI